MVFVSRVDLEDPVASPSLEVAVQSHLEPSFSNMCIQPCIQANNSLGTMQQL